MSRILTYAAPSSQARTGSSRRAGLFVASALWLTLTAAGCQTEHAPLDARVAPGTGADLLVQTGGIQAGPTRLRADVRSGYEGNVHAIQEGRRLYGWFNCAGCHGVLGGGGMGPPLRDGAWIYGSAPQNVYQSIAQGRPQGMPAFQGLVPEDSLWKLTAFVRSLGGGPAQEEPGSVVSGNEAERSAQPKKGPDHAGE